MADQADGTVTSWLDAIRLQLERYFGPDWTAFLIVCCAGAIGGILWPYLEALRNSGASNVASVSIFVRMFLGIAAAGIGCFILANTNRDHRNHLFFFALLCGLAFPAVLISATDSLEKKSAQASEASKSAKDPDDVKRILNKFPASELTPEVKQSIEDKSEAIIAKSALESINTNVNTQQQISELKELGIAAGSNGFSGVKANIVDALGTLSKSELPPEDRKAAEGALSEISTASVRSSAN